MSEKEVDQKMVQTKVTKLWDAVNVFYIIFNGHLISFKNLAWTFLWVSEWVEKN